MTVTMDSAEVAKMDLARLIRLCRPLAEQLEVTKARQDETRSQGDRRSSSATPFIFRIGASEVLDKLTAVLRTIVVEFVVESGRRRHVMLSVPAMVDRLGEHESWVVKHGKAEEWREQLRSVCLDAIAMVDIPPERVFLGRCSEVCSVEIWAELGADFVTCPRCAEQWDVRARTRAGLERAERWQAPLSRVVAMLAGAGERINLEQAKKWTIRRDRHGRLMLSPSGLDESGVKVYRLGDVRRAMLRTATRKPRSRTRAKRSA